MSYFYLPKGTIVKHGTSIKRAENIIRNGFSLNERNEIREKYEIAPESKGVYIGELLAYFGAYAAYTSELNSFFTSGMAEEAMSYFYIDPIKLKKLNLSIVPITLPVVLNIELGEDCVLIADEDFVLDGNYPADQKVPINILISEAETVWQKWKTGCICNEIKKEWIKEVEYPGLNKFGHHKVSEETWLDIELFAGGVLQSYHKEEPTPLIEVFKEKRGLLALSNKTPATRAGIEKILKSQKFKSKADQLFNHILFNEYFQKLAVQYDLPLFRNT